MRLTREGHSWCFMDPELIAAPGVHAKLSPMVGQGENE